MPAPEKTWLKLHTPLEATPTRVVRDAAGADPLEKIASAVSDAMGASAEFGRPAGDAIAAIGTLQLSSSPTSQAPDSPRQGRRGEPISPDGTIYTGESTDAGGEGAIRGCARHETVWDPRTPRQSDGDPSRTAVTVRISRRRRRHDERATPKSPGN